MERNISMADATKINAVASDLQSLERILRVHYSNRLAANGAWLDHVATTISKLLEEANTVDDGRKGKPLMERLCEVCERDAWDVGTITHTEFDTWECEPCHEQSQRLERGEGW